jgi:thioredoxin 1
MHYSLGIDLKEGVMMNGLFVTLLVFLFLVAGYQAVLLIRAKKQQGKAAPPLSEVLPDGVPVRPKMLFYFYSEHCGHCRKVTPLIESLEREHDGVVKVDVRRQLSTARRFGVKVTPSLYRVEDGAIADVHVGEISRQHLHRFYPG